MGAIVDNQGTSVQRPLARQRVRLSRRVHAYYGLIHASGCPPTVTYGCATGICSFRPRYGSGRDNQRVPHLLRGAFRPCRLPDPGGPAGCPWLSLPPRHWPSPGQNGLGIHIEIFEAAEFA
jgi:hypothetical protein